MTIFDAHSSGVRALVRTGRPGREAVEWGEPFEAALYLQKDHKGRTCIVALQGRGDFAEFDPRYHLEGEGLLETEDFLLEVLELPSRQQQLTL